MMSASRDERRYKRSAVVPAFEMRPPPLDRRGFGRLNRELEIAARRHDDHAALLSDLVAGIGRDDRLADREMIP